MVELLVFISFVFILMTLTLFYIIKGIIDNIKEKSKLYFAVKIQEYEEEKKKRDEEESQINKVNKERKIEYADNVNDGFVYVENSKDYEVEDVFKLTKIIDNNFKLNPEDLIINFISQNVTYKNLDVFDSLVEIKDKIKEYQIYNLITDANLKEEFVKLLKSKYKKIYYDYMLNSNVFDVNNFAGYIDSMISEYNPRIIILVGKEEENYDKIDCRIKTVYDNSIYKGFKIIYKNKLYDYSLS